MSVEYSPHLVRLVQQVVKSAIDQSQRKTRHSGSLSGTVEDIDDDLDIVYVRMDQETMGSDPTVSDNYEMPGVLPVTRIGEAYINEQVRVVFDPGMTANALRTSTENKIVLPYGREEGQRIILDGNTGAIGFFNDDDEMVGYLDALQWFVGTPSTGVARLDPVGGLRVWDQDEQLRGLFSATEGLQVRDKTSGITSASVRSDGIFISDPATGETLTLSSGNISTVPVPRWAGAKVDSSPGTTHSTPATSSFGSGDDLDLRFVTASAAANIASNTYSPPAGYAEQTDVFDAGDVTLAGSLAIKDPADASPATASFTASSSAFTRVVGHSVVLRGGGTSSPAIGSIEPNPVQTFNGDTIELTINTPPTPNDGDIMIAHIALAGGAIPVGWTVPEGWKQLGVQAAGLGTSHVLGSGIWYRLWKTGDPTSEQIIINMTADVETKVCATVLNITNPYAFPAGLDIRRNNRSMPRGRITQSLGLTTVSRTNTTLPHEMNGLVDLALLAGRRYRFTVAIPVYAFAALSASCRWEIRLRRDGVHLFTPFHRQLSAAGTERGSIYGSFDYVPTTDEASDWDLQVVNLVSGSGYSVDLVGSAAAPRALVVDDLGGEF